MKRFGIVAALALLLAAPALAQTITGNASLGVSTTSARVAIPGTSGSYLMLQPISSGGVSEVFYTLGDSAAIAAVTSPAMPPGGICLNIGPATNVAAITASGTAGLRITRLTLCAPF